MNYSKQYSKNNKPDEFELEPAQEVEETVVVDEPEVTEVPTPAEPVCGKVVDCTKLNVRKNASKNATVVCTIDCGVEVLINEEESTNEFYKVYTPSGAEGFCMKKFVTVEQ